MEAEIQTDIVVRPVRDVDAVALGRVHATCLHETYDHLISKAALEKVSPRRLAELWTHWAAQGPEFKIFAASKIAGITTAAWMMIVIAIATAILLGRTTFGRYVYATGGNAEAARLGGVRINTVRIATFALSGMAAALAGTIDASRVLSIQASAGGFLTFTALTGIVVGGTSILGGEGSVGRTVVGCLFVALVANGFNLLGMNPTYQQVTLGIILLLAVGTDAWSRRQA